MRKSELTRCRVVVLLLLSGILSTYFVSQRSLNHTAIAEFIPGEELHALGQYSMVPPHDSVNGFNEGSKSPEAEVISYKQKKKIIYKPRPDCIRPGFLPGYENPCWVSTQARKNIACSAKIVLLGFQMSGTTSLSGWFSSNKNVSFTAGDLFKDNLELTTQCPLKWLEDFDNSKRHSSHQNKTAYNDCPGCVLDSRVVGENSTHLIRQSAIQYLQYTMVDNSRYIITMREPADRMIFHFFYEHKTKKTDNPYQDYSSKNVGNDFFHGVVQDTVAALTKCLTELGTIPCILEPSFTAIEVAERQIIPMVTIGCYATHLKEVFQFIPKEKIYFAKMDEYAKDELKTMKDIYKFVGVPTDSLNKHDKSKNITTTKSPGEKTKPVLPETVEVLQKFYEPFNQELSKLLKDDKWLWL